MCTPTGPDEAQKGLRSAILAPLRCYLLHAVSPLDVNPLVDPEDVVPVLQGVALTIPRAADVWPLVTVSSREPQYEFLYPSPFMMNISLSYLAVLRLKIDRPFLTGLWIKSLAGHTPP